VTLKNKSPQNTATIAAKNRKRKGFATVRLQDGTRRETDIHWYEASGIGKRYIDIQP